MSLRRTGQYKEETQTRFERANPGTLYRFLEGVAVILDREKRKVIQQLCLDEVILMYLETIEFDILYLASGSTMLYYEHKFLDLDGRVVVLGGQFSTNAGLPWHVMEEVI